MSTTYEPKLLVGTTLEEVEETGKFFKGTQCDLIWHLEADLGMIHIEDCDFVGFEIEDETLELNTFNLSMVSGLARKFERATGLPARIKACVFSY